MIVNKENVQAFFTGLKTVFNDALQKAPSAWREVATHVPSEREEEHYGWLENLGGLRKWLGDRQISNLVAHDYKIKNEPWERTYAIKRLDFINNNFAAARLNAEQFAVAANRSIDLLVFRLLKNGFTSICYDGQYFFDSDHPVGNGVASNVQAGTGEPWFLLDTSQVLKPLIFQQREEPTFGALTGDETEPVWRRDEFEFGIKAYHNAGYGLWQLAFGSRADLTTDNFNAAYAAMQSLKNDDGEPLGVTPTLLVTGPALRAAAKQVVESERLPNNQNNPNYNVVKTLITPYLS